MVLLIIPKTVWSRIRRWTTSKEHWQNRSTSDSIFKEI